MKKVVGLAFLLSLLSAPALAEDDAATFLKGYEGASSGDKGAYENAALTMYLGIGWAESAVESMSKKRNHLFCEPDDARLTGPLVIGKMTSFLASHTNFQTEPYGLVILMSLVTLWPCPTDMAPPGPVTPEGNAP